MAETNGIFISSGGGGSNSAPIEDWIIDYKTWGQNSYVYKNKDILHQMYEAWQYTMNDEALVNEAYAYAEETNKIGEALSNIYEIENKELFNTVTSYNEIANNKQMTLTVLSNPTSKKLVEKNKNALNVFANNTVSMTAIVEDQTVFDELLNINIGAHAFAFSQIAINLIVNNTLAFDKVRRNSFALNRLVTAGSELTLPFWKKLNTNATYLTDMYTLLIDSTDFIQTNGASYPVNNTNCAFNDSTTSKEKTYLFFIQTGYATGYSGAKVTVSINGTPVVINSALKNVSYSNMGISRSYFEKSTGAIAVSDVTLTSNMAYGYATLYWIRAREYTI